MARIPDSEIERLKVESDLVGIVAASGVKLEKRGADHVGCCPFHDDKTPSLVISPDKNLWRCFGACDVGGDPIAWVMRREAVSFRHAVELLKGDYAPDPAAPAAPAKTRSTVAKLAPLATPAEDAALLGEVAGFYHAALKTTPEALAYLERRGLTHPDVIDTFGLGTPIGPWAIACRRPTARPGRRSGGGSRRWVCCARAATNTCADPWWSPPTPWTPPRA